MITIDNTIISNELIEKKFVCDLKKCKGECCVEGDEGAPLEEEEISIIEDYIDRIKPYMTEEGRKVVEKIGVFDYGADGDFVTPLVNERECAFTIFENGIAFCAIEKAFLEKEIDFQKPISCHLYPIRIQKYKDFEAVNYHQWHVCNCAVKLGEKLDVPVYEFLKEPLIRKYGEQWYKKLEEEAWSKK